MKTAGSPALGWEGKRNATGLFFCKKENYGVEIANFFQIVLSSHDQNIKYHLYNEEENKKERLLVNQQKTGNPYIVLTKAEENK